MKMEADLKSMVLIVAFLAGLGCVTAWAESPEPGIYIGGAAGIQLVPGTGTWAEYDFKIDNPLSVEDDGAVGFAWTDKFLLGIKPLMGYRINSTLALQVGYGLNIPKSSQQTTTQSDGFTSYEQGFSMEWKQRSLEVLGVFHPDSDLGYFLFAGLDLTKIEAKVILYEGLEYEDYYGNLVADAQAQEAIDKISTTGAIFGGGLEFPSEDNNRVVYFSAQYSTAKTNDTFFGTEDFKVLVGGLSFTVGVKWYPFNK
jgi:hypothetical protein